MANETNISLSVSFSKSGVDFAKSFANSLDKGDGRMRSQVVTLTGTDNDLIALATDNEEAAYLVVRNIGTATLWIYHEAGQEDTGQELPEGTFAVLRLMANTTLFADVDTGTASTELVWIPDAAV